MRVVVIDEEKLEFLCERAATELINEMDSPHKSLDRDWPVRRAFSDLRDAIRDAKLVTVSVG